MAAAREDGGGVDVEKLGVKGEGPEVALGGGGGGGVRVWIGRVWEVEAIGGAGEEGGVVAWGFGVGAGVEV